MISRHHYIRELQEDKLDIRFIRSENNSSDVMTKNAARELFEKHSRNIRNGILAYWEEDVKSDPSVTMFGNLRDAEQATEDNSKLPNKQKPNKETSYDKEQTHNKEQVIRDKENSSLMKLKVKTT